MASSRVSRVSPETFSAELYNCSTQNSGGMMFGLTTRLAQLYRTESTPQLLVWLTTQRRKKARIVVNQEKEVPPYCVGQQSMISIIDSILGFPLDFPWGLVGTHGNPWGSHTRRPTRIHGIARCTVGDPNRSRGNPRYAVGSHENPSKFTAGSLGRSRGASHTIP